LEKLQTKSIRSHHVYDFLDQLQEQLKSRSEQVFYRWDSLRVELEESIANESLALAYRQRWQCELAGQARDYSRFWDWLIEEYSASSMLAFLEQWASFGHPSHPNFRAKMGFSRREVLQCSPEFQAKVRLHWCALRRSCATTTTVELPYEIQIEKQFPHEYQAWRNSLAFKHHNPDEFYPMPVHPWQWQNRLQTSLSNLVDKKDIILLPHHQVTRPSLSFRTMIPYGEKACHLKLATAIHTTSATRTVSPGAIHNGPALSAWINRLLTRHNHYQHRLYLAKEMSGIHLNDTTCSPTEQKQLALILRENPIVSLQEGQSLIPLAALFAPSPISKKPLLFDLINSSDLSPEEYFERYCDCVIYGQLHLMLRYGVALEAHQQNTLVVVKENQPQALVIRDLGGISIGDHAVYQDAYRPVLHPESNLVVGDLSQLCQTFIHGNLQSNLAYWIRYISEYYPISAQTLWRKVFITLIRAMNSMSSEIDAEILSRQRKNLLSNPWQHKCLLSMRLIKGHKSSLLVPVSNPLSQFHD
jgi:siderophore synthetase component